MAASNAFVEGLLDIIDETFNSAVLSDQAKKDFVMKIYKLNSGNTSVGVTQARLLMAAKKRWF